MARQTWFSENVKVRKNFFLAPRLTEEGGAMAAIVS